MRSLQCRWAELRMRWARLQRARAARRAGTKPQPLQPERPNARQRRQLQIESSFVEGFDGFEVFRLKPPEPATGAQASQRAGRLVFLHGGAYLRPITRHHWDFLADLALRSGCELVVPLYPLAPRHHGDAALRFVQALYRRELATLGRRQLLLAGDSAGAGLALALALWLRDEGLPPPRLLTLISPWVDLEVPHPDAARLAPRDPILSLPGLRRAGRLYAGPLGTGDPRISPARANPAGLPPVALHVGGHDLLGPDALAWAARARAAGCAVSVNEAPAMMHVWPLLAFPEARTARALIATQIRAALDGPATAAARGADWRDDGNPVADLDPEADSGSGHQPAGF